MAVSDVKKIYQDVINDVCTAVREALSEEGYDDHTLTELKTLWLGRLENSKALEPPKVSAVDESTSRIYGRTITGDTHNKQAAGITSAALHPASYAAISSFNTPSAASSIVNAGNLSMVNLGATARQIRPANMFNRPPNPMNFGNNQMKTSNQLDGANDEIISSNNNKDKNSRKKKSKIIQIEFQLDGTGPPAADDDDDDDESEVEGNDVADELEDDDDEDGNEEGREDPNPLCSDDDVSDDEPAELFDTDNVVVCQYDKISRTKNKWRFILKSGVMNIEGRDYVFSKANGDADW